MKNKLILLCAIFCSMQIMATNLVLSKSDGTQQLQDIATIGKLLFVGDDIQLVSHDGTVWAKEAISNIRKITFADAETAVENIESNKQIVIYPNPTQDILIISGIEAQELHVFDLQGRMLKTENATQVNVSTLPNGTYLLQVGTQVVRFIKN
jgi:hypothetical protein